MTMLSFRVDDEEAANIGRWAQALGIDKSELLREAVHNHLTRLASENDATVWVQEPLSQAEMAVAEIADWGPAEDWSDWIDEAR